MSDDALGWVARFDEWGHQHADQWWNPLRPFVELACRWRVRFESRPSKEKL